MQVGGGREDMTADDVRMDSERDGWWLTKRTLIKRYVS